MSLDSFEVLSYDSRCSTDMITRSQREWWECLQISDMRWSCNNNR